MSGIKKLIECDQENLNEGINFVNKVNSNSIATVEYGNSLFYEFARAFGESVNLSFEGLKVAQWCNKYNIPPDEAMKLLINSKLVGSLDGNDLTENAKKNVFIKFALELRTFLLLRLGRDYLFGITDLLKNRVISAIGYLRIQSETLGLLRLMSDNPEVSLEWLNAGLGESGKQFYRNYQRKINEILKGYDLYRYYELGSSMTYHSRIGGLAFGILHRHANSNNKMEIGLSYQDIKDSRIFFIWFCIYMRVHQMIISAIPGLLPEIKDIALIENKVQEFSKMVNDLWNKARPMFDELNKCGLANVFLGFK